MQKYILIIAFLFSGILAQAQIFVQGAFGLKVFENSLNSNSLKGGNGIDLQIGRFVTNQKMRSFKLTYRFGRNHNPDNFEYTTYVGGTYRYYSVPRKTTSSVISLGYERKKCFADTEFDDAWQYYNIISYQLSFISIKDELADPTLKQNNVFDDDYSGSKISILDVTLGLGMARKLSQKTYLYAEARYFSPAIDFGTFYSGAGFRTNFGIRQFIR